MKSHIHAHNLDALIFFTEVSWVVAWSRFSWIPAKTWNIGAPVAKMWSVTSVGCAEQTHIENIMMTSHERHVVSNHRSLDCLFNSFVVPYPSGLLHWHCGNLTTAPVPAKQPWWIWINTSCEFIMNDCITTTKQSTTKPCAYFLGYTVYASLGFDGLITQCFSQNCAEICFYESVLYNDGTRHNEPW